MNILVEELKLKIFKELNLVEINPDDLKPDDPLFGDGLGLDSIDALELVVIFENDYGISVPEMEDLKPHLRNLQTLADFVHNNRKK